MILLTGATGFLGKRVAKKLEERGLAFCKTSLSMGPDLRDAAAVHKLFAETKPDKVINCAAYVGGIQFGYKHPAELFRNNLLMTINLLDACKEFSVKRLVNPISNCAYPARATFFKENEFWEGSLHESVMVYGHARKTSWVGAWAYEKQYGLDSLNLILSNMYGPEDHFEEERSHALGALIMKIVKAKRENLPEVIVWGSGTPVREWLYVDDGAEAMVRGLDAPHSEQPVNIGVGKGISIIDMAKIIQEDVGYTGELKLDPSKPDGAPYKTVDGTRGGELLGWRPEKDFHVGIRETVQWYMEHC
jgi:NAD-dependent epimerase/dehydratase